MQKDNDLHLSKKYQDIWLNNFSWCIFQYVVFGALKIFLDGNSIIKYFRISEVHFMMSN